MYWNGFGDIGIGFAREGRVLRGTGDELPIGDDDADPDVTVAFEGLDPSVHDRIYSGLIAIERFTGLRIDGDPLPEPALVYPLPPMRQRLLPALGVIRRVALIHEGDEDRSALSSAIGRLSPAEQRRLAASAVRTMIGVAEMPMSPELAEAVEWLTNPAGPRFSEPMEIAMLRAHAAESRGARNFDIRTFRVLGTAANPDPYLAALEAVWGVRETLSPAGQEMYDTNVLRYIDEASRRG